MRKKSERGFTVLALVLSLVALVALAGLAVDIGRMYIAKNEVQSFADSASLAATMELDGTWEGITRAENQAYGNPNRWNFGTSNFSDVKLSFAKEQAGPWEEEPLTPTQYRYARVSSVAQLPLTFLSVIAQDKPLIPAPAAMFLASLPTVGVRGDSAAGQQQKRRWREGLFPFSPFKHSDQAPHFGLVPGQLYTLRWPAAPRLNQNVCPGDNVQAILNLAESDGASERGYIESTSADIIRATIEQDYQSVERVIGEPVFMSGGAKETQRSSLITRLKQDRDAAAATYAEYLANNRGNGRRIVGVPINSGYPSYTIVQIGAFFLQPEGQYHPGGGQPWCAEYLGPFLQGSQHKGAGDAGAYIARLVK